MTNAEIAAKCSPCIYATPCDDGIVQKCRNCEQQPAITAALDAKDAQFREFTERGGRLLIEVEARRDEARALYMEAEEKFSNEVSRADAAEQKLRDVTRTLDEACADADAAEALADRYRGELKVTADWLAVQDSMAAADVAQRIRTALKGTA